MAVDPKESISKLANNWIKYPSIANVNLDLIHKPMYSDKKVCWVACEKVHGANMTILTDGIHILTAKRTALLQESDKFFSGWHNVVRTQRNHILKTFAFIKNNIDCNVVSISVYGELFGGNFNYKSDAQLSIDEFDTEFAQICNDSKKQYSLIQKNVSYSPYHHFYPFDIRVYTTDKKANNECVANDPIDNVANTNEEKIDSDSESKIESYFLDFKTCVCIFEKMKFEIYATPIMNGTLCEIVEKFDINSFVSEIPQKLGIKVEPTSDIIAEGIVIRRWQNSHSIRKYKSHNFLEVTGVNKQKNCPQKKESIDNPKKEEIIKSDKSQQNQKKQCPKLVSFRELALQPNCLNGDESILNFIAQCINDNRYSTVLSKIGTLTNTNVTKTVGMFTGDVWTDVSTHFTDQLSKIEKKKQRPIKQYISESVKLFMSSDIEQLRADKVTTSKGGCLFSL